MFRSILLGFCSTVLLLQVAVILTALSTEIHDLVTRKKFRSDYEEDAVKIQNATYGYIY